MKKYLIALSLVGLATTSCYEKLNIAPPNAKEAVIPRSTTNISTTTRHSSFAAI